MKFGCRGGVALSLALNVFAAGGAVGLVIESEEDALNHQAPADDPGWANVGVCKGWTAVYLGRGWVLTAAHVGTSNINLEGTVYAADIKSRERVLNPDGAETDLMLFRIEPEPNLPPLKISTESPPIGSPIVMVGSGLGRGEKTSGQGRVGFSWQAPAVKRWGTSAGARASARSIGRGHRRVCYPLLDCNDRTRGPGSTRRLRWGGIRVPRGPMAACWNHFGRGQPHRSTSSFSRVWEPNDDRGSRSLQPIHPGRYRRPIGMTESGLWAVCSLTVRL